MRRIITILIFSIGLVAIQCQAISVSAIPFYTDFNLGYGESYFVDGVKVSDVEWNQDILNNFHLTNIEPNNDLPIKTEMSFTDAYNGGSALLVTGQIAAQKTDAQALLKSDIILNHSSRILLVHKNTNSNISLTLRIKVDNKIYFLKPTMQMQLSNGWVRNEYSLQKYREHKLQAVALQFSNYGNNTQIFKMLLGQVQLLDAGSMPMQTQTATIKNQIATWKPIEGAKLYRIYQLVDKNLLFIGVTKDTAYPISNIEHQYRIQSVATNGESSKLLHPLLQSVK